jgi:maleamate amidohydrolase
MNEPIWNRFLTERDRQVLEASGLGVRQGFGKRPAVLIVDVSYDFTGDRPEPILESIKRWGNSCGAEAWEGIKAIQRLLAAARAKELPVIYTMGTRRPDNWDSGSWSWKNSRLGERQTTRESHLPGHEIVREIAPRARDIVIDKQKASAFYGTPLASYLTLLCADSLIVAGVSTSGCVRATVVDAHANNYRVAVVEEGCFDRSQASHAINLCDMHSRYADVVKLDEALTFIGTLATGMFDLPNPRPSIAPKGG